MFMTSFRTYKIATPPQTKMTSKDDIKGLVSLKFLRPWSMFSVLSSERENWGEQINPGGSTSVFCRIILLVGGIRILSLKK